ncbi:MAG: glucodextranase DOMON-like domain-containing protein [Desulfurococcaceae archaeon]
MSIDKSLQVLSIIILLIIAVNTLIPLLQYTSAQQEKIYIAFIWHYHQPWYYSPDETYFILPWVRMHSIGNYYKMAYILSKYPSMRVTFTFSGSLLEQIVDYVENNKRDLREIISWRVVNGTISVEDVFNMLRTPGGFFDINWANIVNRSPRYRELRDLAQNITRECSLKAKTDEELIQCVVSEFTQGDLVGANVVDLAVLFNLLWIDPQVAREKYPDVYGLMNAAYTGCSKPCFSRVNLTRVLTVQREIMSELLLIYRNLLSRGQVEVIPVPYSHPLAPIIVDSGLGEDLEIHVRLAIDLFNQYLNTTPVGVWPAEQAVNEYVVEAFRKAGMNWTVTDSTILAATGVNTGDIENIGVPWYIDFVSGRIYIFFRETDISNLISFQYSGWDQDSAVVDLVNRILNYRNNAKGPRLVVIALDGENPWEHYPEFGTIFLNKLYSRLDELQRQGILETITPGEFIKRFGNVARPLPEKTYQYLDLEGKDISDIPANNYGDGYYALPRRQVRARLPEGSWGGGEVAIWIGHRQENVAHMWMVKARSDVLGKLGINSMRVLYERYPLIARYLLKSQASDWWWWYGGDGGGSPATFDPLFKAYLTRAYELSGLQPPEYLRVSAYPDGQPIGTINQVPPGLVDMPIALDGIIEDDWIKLVQANKALRVVVGTKLPEVYVGIDTTKLYLAFVINYTDLQGLKIAVYFATPSVKMSPYNQEFNLYPRGRNIDLGIHLARELLIDPIQKTATISIADGTGGWRSITTINTVYVARKLDQVTIEVSIDITSLNLAMGQPAYLVIVVYQDMNPVEWSSRLGLAYIISVPTPPVELIGRLIVYMEDPVGDDNGIGTVKYPTNPVFKPGVFDLVNFTIIDGVDRLLFKFQFGELGGNPWGGPNGWSLQQIHMYILTSINSEGRKDTFGLNVKIEHGWHLAIIIAPGWGTTPVPDGERSGIYYYDKAESLVQDGELVPRADQARKEILVEVSKDVLYDVENIDKWVIVVAVVSHDGYGINRIRAIQPGDPAEWTLGGGDPLAILAGVQPLIIDLLAPTADEQYQMLRSYDTSTRELARIHGVRIADYLTRPTPIETPTTTPSPTPTLTETITETTIVEKPGVLNYIIVAIIVFGLATLASFIALRVSRRRSVST